MEAKGIASFFLEKEREITVRLSEASHPRAFERKGGFVRVSSGHVRLNTRRLCRMLTTSGSSTSVISTVVWTLIDWTTRQEQ